MANKDVSLIINTTDSGRNKRQKAITSVNPLATDGELYRFGTALNDLTNNSLDGLVRVERNELEPVSYQLLGADAIYLQFTGNTNDDIVVSNYVLVDENGNPQPTVWTLNPIGDSIPGSIATVNYNYDTPEKSGYFSIQAVSNTGITEVYTYEISTVYNEVTYSKQVRAYLYAKGE